MAASAPDAARIHLPRSVGPRHANNLGQPLYAAQRDQRLSRPAPLHAAAHGRSADAAIGAASASRFLKNIANSSVSTEVPDRRFPFIAVSSSLERFGLRQLAFHSVHITPF